MDQEERPSREGEVLKGKYELGERLGSGGMGEVYRARNVLVDRTVAIKILHPDLARDPNVLQRFLREAKAANVVRHRNIVDVLDIDADPEGLSFIVQEFLEGVDLATHIADMGGKLDTREALDLLIPVADAVGAAHARGLVHRDLKPENVLLALNDDEIVPKVLDFGISKFPLAPAGDGKPAARASVSQHVRLTAIAGAVGTPAYMSPEQIKDSASVDARADVWALGVVLYEALGGELPYDADTLPELFAKICTQSPVPLAKLNPAVPSALARVVHRALSPDRETRYADGGALAHALSAVRRSLANKEANEAETASSKPAPAPVSTPGRDSFDDVELVLSPSNRAGPRKASSPPAGGRRDSAPVADPVQWELAAPQPRSPFPAPPSGQPGAKRSLPAPGAVSLPPSGSASDDLLDWDEVIGVPTATLELQEEPERDPTRSKTMPAAVGLTPLSQRPKAPSSPPEAISFELGGDAPPGSSRAPRGMASRHATPPTSGPTSNGSGVRPAPAASARPVTPVPSSRPAQLERRTTSSTAPAVSSSPPSRRQRVLTGSRTVKLVGPGAIVRVVLSVLFVLALAAATPKVSPAGMAWAIERLGAWAALPYAAAFVPIAAATLWVLARAGRGPSIPLLVAGVALLLVTVGVATAALALGVPGLVGHTWRAVALVAAPWASMVAVAGLAVHAAAWGQQLVLGGARHAGLRWSLRVAAVGGLAAIGFLALQPRTTLERIAKTAVSPAEQAVAGRLDRVGIITLGASRLTRARQSPDLVSDATAAAAGGPPSEDAGVKVGQGGSDAGPAE